MRRTITYYDSSPNTVTMPQSNQQTGGVLNTELVLPSPALREAIAQVCERDRDFLKIEATTEPLRVRRWPPTFASLVRIILGQQLSAKAAMAIFLRAQEQMELTPANFANCPDTTLKQIGFSQNKIAACKRIANAILENHLNLDAFSAQPDSVVISELTQIKGIGQWTAQIYLLFCLERLDSFPALDLAIQYAYQRLKQLEQKPTGKELVLLCQPLQPYRGAAAHLLWHYYRHRTINPASKENA